MEVISTIAEMRARLAPQAKAGHSIGFVPTMGYLHKGHMGLIERAKSANHIAVASIFINPLQFSPSEDFARYPRDFERDRLMLEAHGCDFLFAPSVAEMYPRPMETFVAVGGLENILEGERRPGHFRGVATVVAKLFSIVHPTRAYFGEKDFQQLAVIRRMTADLSMPIEIVGVPTVREDDGLACSSRNVYLSPQERRAAIVLYQAMKEAALLAAKGTRDSESLKAAIEARLAAEPLATSDLVDVRDADSLEPLYEQSRNAVFLLAVRFGPTRLIDQMVVPLM